MTEKDNPGAIPHLKLWKLTAPRSGWGTYDSAVVAAETEEKARGTHPAHNEHFWYSAHNCWYDGSDDQENFPYKGGDWPSPSEVTVTYLGDAAPGIEAGVIVASYNPE